MTHQKKIFCSANSNIDNYVLHEDPKYFSQAIFCLKDATECDQYYLCKARLAFLKLYPIPCDFSNFKDLISCLEDTADERNPIYWLNRASDSADGRIDYMRLSETFKQAVILTADTHAKGPLYPLSSKYYKKPRTGRSSE